MRSEIHLDYVVILEDGLVPRVGCVVGGHVVPGAPSGEGQPGLQTVLLDQAPAEVKQGLGTTPILIFIFNGFLKFDF